MKDKNVITEVTRRQIIDYIITSRYSWSGRLSEEEFLSRLYDLEQLPSNDSRFSTASGDIWQHCVRNNDWDGDWVFHDRRFNLLRSSDEDFLRFLCEMINPIVRPDQSAVSELLAEFNSALAQDGWEIFESKRISGRPVFAARKIGGKAEVFTESTGWPKVDRQIEEAIDRLREASSEEQYQVVGLICREALISVAQAVFRPGTDVPLDNVTPAKTDAKRMLEAFIESVAKGSHNEEIRAHAKASLKLAVALQHDRGASFRTAALCVEATSSVINIVAILAGRRGGQHTVGMFEQ
jgi:hypothetical protein